MADQEKIYDERYMGDYREQLSGFESARLTALDHYVTRILSICDARTVLDYGSGTGLYVDLWEKLFPDASLSFCDISSVAREKFGRKYPQHADAYRLIHDGRADLADGSFDVVVSVEVMEHVEDLVAYLKDIRRLLRPGGRFVWTTPCANNLSIEHIFSFVTGAIDRTSEGYRRWRWEDPTHVRRLKSREIAEVLRECGFADAQFRFRSHFFSFVCTHTPPRSAFKALRERMMTLDYLLFRRISNGASMLGCALAVNKPLQ